MLFFFQIYVGSACVHVPEGSLGKRYRVLQECSWNLLTLCYPSSSLSSFIPHKDIRRVEKWTPVVTMYSTDYHSLELFTAYSCDVGLSHLLLLAIDLKETNFSKISGCTISTNDMFRLSNERPSVIGSILCQ